MKVSKYYKINDYQYKLIAYIDNEDKENPIEIFIETDDSIIGYINDKNIGFFEACIGESLANFDELIEQYVIDNTKETCYENEIDNWIW